MRIETAIGLIYYSVSAVVFGGLVYVVYLFIKGLGG